ncbi:MAG TPA: hypothetical protein VKA27_04445, partial [Sunxiuqinia sp.]|nr:hypothetical protein [Sunxiuqinia sp.]
SHILVELASGLSVPNSFHLKNKHVEEIKEKSFPVKLAMKKLAGDLYASSFGLRVFSGLDPDEGDGFKSVIKSCSCCGDNDSELLENPVEQLDLESGIATTVGGKGEDLNEYVTAISNDFERLKDIIMLLALYILWLASQPYLATNAGGPPCDDEGTPSANVIGTTITNVSAPLVPTTTRSFQPQCNVKWDFCCTNICFIIYEENFVVSVTNGPHNLGAQVRLIAGQNAKTAQLVANRRAARFQPINSLTPPAKPSC